MGDLAFDLSKDRLEAILILATSTVPQTKWSIMVKGNRYVEAKDRLRIEFNEWARTGRGESMERGHRPVGEQAIEKMLVPDDARVLDVGCGSGWASRLLAEKSGRGRVVGIDISDEMIRLATETSKEFSNLTFQVASAEDLPPAPRDARCR